MLVPSTLLFTHLVLSAVAAPIWCSEVSLLYNNKLRVTYKTWNDRVRGFQFQDIGIEPRSKPEAQTDEGFAKISVSEKKLAVEFINSFAGHHIQDAASASTRTRTIYANSQFHLDRQQPITEGFKSTIAVQRNSGGRPSTIAQVKIAIGTDPGIETIRGFLRASIWQGKEYIVPETKKMKNIRMNEEKRKAKAERIRKAQLDGSKGKAKAN